MKIKLTSYGASGEVTGSCHLLDIDGFRILVDCGLWQGSWQNYLKNWNEFSFDPRRIDAVILSHTHLDHCGRLPLLYTRGYRGPVYSTAATAELASIVIEDNIRIMAAKARKNKLPKLYAKDDYNKLRAKWQTLDYYQTAELGRDIKIKLHNAGHILGSALVEIKAGGQTIVFSGDLGAIDMPLIKNVDYLSQADHIIMESTYGDRRHEDIKDRKQKLLDAVRRTTVNNSTLLISIFAVERSQDVLKVLNDFYEGHLDFRVPVYLDSPMAAAATRVYNQHLELLNQGAQESLAHDKDIFKFPHLTVTTQTRQSKRINAVPPPKIILAGSGMAEGGRMLHHLAHIAPGAKNNILFMGFQVPGTLGHKFINGAFDFNYYGKTIKIKAVVDQIDGFSAHADSTALLKWLSHFPKQAKVHLVHGDRQVMEKFASSIEQTLNMPAQIMPLAQTIELN